MRPTRRNFSARGRRFRHVDAVLGLIADGMSVEAACRSRRDFPTAAQFNNRLRTDPDLRARFDAVCARAGRSRPNLEALEHADAILTLVEHGMSVRKACAADRRFPTRDTFVAALKYASELELRYDLAMAARERPHWKSRAAFDEIERRIIAGAAILGILNSDRRRFPDYTSFKRFLRANPEFDARYRAAGRKRQAGPNALGQGPAYSATELQRAATELLLSNDRAIYAKRIGSAGPHTATLMRARFRDPGLLVAVESAVVQRRSRLGIVNGRPKVDPSNVRLAAPVRAAPASLSSDELWRRAISCLPSGLDADLKNDLAADLVVLMLEGRASPQDLAKHVPAVLAEHRKRFDISRRHSELDAPIGGDSSLLLVDMISSGW